MPNQRILRAIFSAANSQRESSAFMRIIIDDFRSRLGIVKGGIGRIEPACAMDAGAGMGGCGAEIDTRHGRAVAEIRKDGTPEELVGKLSAAAAEIAADQVF